jgi:biotin-dependent carboxylase-like uncharacterized protein
VSAALRVLSAGPGVSLQDAGRRGYLRFGVTWAGPMDPFAFAVANAALSRPAGSTAIEVSLGGLELQGEGEPMALALAGGRFQASLDGAKLPSAAVVTLAPGAKLTIRAGSSGAWCYVAVGGDLDVPPVLGSTSTHTRSGIGGIAGRGLQPEDALPVRALKVAERIGTIAMARPGRPGDPIRILPGPQDDYFAPDQIQLLCSTEWVLSGRSDRMAYMLDGPRLTHSRGFNIVSDGIAMGAIQVPGDGRAIVLMADRQPTGGYPKIATVIGADLGRLAQHRPGERFRFARASLAEAVAARRAEAALIAGGIPIEPLVRKNLSSEYLLGHNLIACVVAGTDID